MSRCEFRVDNKGQYCFKCPMSVLELVSLVREDGKSVEEMSLITRSSRQTLIWDATCSDAFALSVREAGRAADYKTRR